MKSQKTPDGSAPPKSVSGEASHSKNNSVFRALRTLSAGNRTLLRAREEAELLQDMCRVIVEQGGYRVAAVGYAEHDARKSIRLMACVGTEHSALEELHLTWADTDLGHAAAGTAIRTGQPSIGRHLLSDPAYQAVRDHAQKAGYGAASAFPLRIDDETIGALSILAAEPDAFDEAEVRLLGELADDLAYGIANLRVRVKHRDAEQTIERMAYYDAMTGLPNRVLFRERLSHHLEVAKRNQQPLALLVVKANQMQEINGALGYLEGDRFLQAISASLTALVSDADTLARVGEDEFAVLLPNGDAARATRLAHKLLDPLREPVDLTDFAVDARASVGIALFPGHGADPDLLLRHAITAAALAKGSAGEYAFYTDSLDREFARRLALMGELRRAIANNELRLYCQPKVRFNTGRVCGAEVLVRWQHPQRGMLATGEFIAFAEHAGLITPLTQWVLEAAFRQSYAWREAGLAVPLAVNLSAQDLRDPRLPDRIRGLFATWGTEPELIQFELTESALMEDPAHALEVLTRLKELGVELVIDDFGIGYSSLGYLQRLPVDALKIDQSFVTNMLSSSDSEMIVRSTIDLGHNLGLSVVAEGVESLAVWERLAALGCDTAQGYLISEPLPVEQFPTWEGHRRWPASADKLDLPR